MSRPSRDDLYEQVRRADFNRTEPETVRQLVESAIRIGDEIKNDYVRLRQLTDDILELLKKEDLIKSRKFRKEELAPFYNRITSATDGSFQYVGGSDGIWYAPISVSLIIFHKGINSVPDVRIGARICPIDERKHPNVVGTMETLMLSAEANIIRDWCRDCPEGAILFMDGPVIDPPRLMSRDYVTYRVETIQSCLDKGVFVLGCVKRLLGDPLMEYLCTLPNLRDYEKDRIRGFFSDAHMIYYVFTKASLQGGMTIYTKPLEIGDNKIYKPYKEAGLKIYFMYFQLNYGTKPFRVEIPVKGDLEIDLEQLGEQVAATLCAWSYPGYDLPLPIVIAHEKCNIRRGCAEVIYREIITRAASIDVFDNLVRTKLGTEVL
ncbi:MAG: DNA double-strand break repair nuclease NurA [Candidatus Bathyarchaeia archaeon]